MLLEDSQKLTKESQKVTDLKKYATDLKNFRQRQEQIQALVSKLLPLVNAMQAFKERDIYKFASTQSAEQLLKRLQVIYIKYSENKGFIIGEEFKFRTLEMDFNGLVNSLESELSEAWQEYKKEKVPSTNRELLDLLEKIQTFRLTVQKVKENTQFLDSIIFPRNSGEFSQIDHKISELSSAWNSLKSNEVPESVLNFLKATSTVGASLDSLTPEVETWLRDKDITRLFQIKLI